MKYRAPIADAIRLSRYRGEDPICAFTLAAYSKFKEESAEKLRAAEEKYPVLKARAQFISALTSGDTATAAKLLSDYELDTDSLTAYADRFDSEVWSAAARTAPVMKFLKYLAKYIREGVEVDRIAPEKLTVENLRHAKVFPFRLYTAEAALRNLPGTEVTCSTLSGLLDRYATEYDWGDFNRFSWVIAPDVSASMGSRIANSKLTFAELSAMFAGFFMKGLRNVRVLPWNQMVLPYDLPAQAPVAEHMRMIWDMIGGCTVMEAPVEYMIEHRIKTDFAVFLTDTEEYGKGWLATWKDYRRLFPEAQAFLLRADTYRTSPISEADSAKYGVWQIFGWNDSVIEYMRSILTRRSA